MAECQQHDNCMERALSRAESVCRKSKLRFTSTRRRVLRIIWQDHKPTKAYDILDSLRLEQPWAQPPTVYRALDFLVENGLVHRLGSLQAYVGCNHPRRHQDCYFLICSQCHGVQECCNGELRSAVGGTAGKNCFLLGKSTLEIGGECRQCRAHGGAGS